MVMVFLMLACGSSSSEITPPTASESDSVAMLTRISMDVRGIRPSVEDVDAVIADASVLDSLVDEYLEDPRFPERIVDLYSEIYLTQAEFFSVQPTAFNFDADVDDFTYARSIGDEPLRILATVASEDLPYTDVVTADWTMHNPVLASMYPTDYPADGSGWQKSRYTDGRPTAGVLSTNGMWWRYGSTTSNMNRKRANQISRIFLCNDYLTRPIAFDRDVNLLDEDAVNDAIENDPGCIACHVSLDPLASYLYGFWYIDDTSAGDATTYHPERELLYDRFGVPEPGYYGESGGNLSDLGHHIAADPRFIECAVEQAYTRLMGRDAVLMDGDALAIHREAFLGGGLTVRALFRSILNHPRYRAATEAPSGFATKKLVTAGLMASQIEGITGFKWTQGGTDMMTSDAVGVGNLAGRADGYRMVRDSRSPNATMLLVSARLAEAAAAHVMTREASQAPRDRSLFTEVTFAETAQTDRTAMTAQIRRLHKAVLGRVVEPDGDEVEANLALWEELYDATDSAHVAWGGLLIALLRDPDFLMY